MKKLIFSFFVLIMSGSIWAATPDLSTQVERQAARAMDEYDTQAKRINHVVNVEIKMNSGIKPFRKEVTLNRPGVVLDIYDDRDEYYAVLVYLGTSVLGDKITRITVNGNQEITEFYSNSTDEPTQWNPNLSVTYGLDGLAEHVMLLLKWRQEDNFVEGVTFLDEESYDEEELKLQLDNRVDDAFTRHVIRKGDSLIFDFRPQKLTKFIFFSKEPRFLLQTQADYKVPEGTPLFLLKNFDGEKMELFVGFEISGKKNLFISPWLSLKVAKDMQFNNYASDIHYFHW